MGFSCLEQCELAANVATLCLVFRHKDALGHEVVGSGTERRTVCKLFYAIEAVGWHLVGGDEHGLGLTFCPFVKTFVVEIFCFVVFVCVFVGNVAIDYAIRRNNHLLVAKHRWRDRQITPPHVDLCHAVYSFSVFRLPRSFGIATCATLLAPSRCCISQGRL